ncbi:glycosyltransferase [Portibacter marinus]|uniref:glycosyltransferase n=1 Tax=Portibacter marinus TaxID=2898660 RepID=UPI001F3894A4|nr:glycosyltransferase [Portibacter marinus]
MLSILIPTYNFVVVDLVRQLNNQCQEANIPYEIVCYDDFSVEEFRLKNRKLDAEFGVSYIELGENKGRSKIRNMLAQNARYEQLLFIDCDSEIDNALFIRKYIESIELRKVIAGGRKYAQEKPSEKSKMLHWYYGTRRESLSVKKRSENPYRYFHSNNFMISRDLMMKFPFEEKISTYGYEDSLFAATLENEGINIKHIENPLIHKGVEDTQDFLRKSKLAAENLAILYHSEALNNTRMIAFHENIKKIGFNSLLKIIIRSRKDQMLKNLHSENPNLFYFDLFRYDVFINKLSFLKASSS